MCDWRFVGLQGPTDEWTLGGLGAILLGSGVKGLGRGWGTWPGFLFGLIEDPALDQRSPFEMRNQFGGAGEFPIAIPQVIKPCSFTSSRGPRLFPGIRDMAVFRWLAKRGVQTPTSRRREGLRPPFAGGFELRMTLFNVKQILPLRSGSSLTRMRKRSLSTKTKRDLEMVSTQ
ncbi:hypothetical protein Ancab_022848 [Ancistrocladus abbreviatus]